MFPWRTLAVRRKKKSTLAMVFWQIRPCYSSGKIDHSGGSDHVDEMKKPTFAKNNDRGATAADWPLLLPRQTWLRKREKNASFGTRGTRRHFGGFALDSLEAGLTIQAKKKRAGQHFLGLTPIIVPVDLVAETGGIQGSEKRRAQWQFGRFALVIFWRS